MRHRPHLRTPREPRSSRARLLSRCALGLAASGLLPGCLSTEGPAFLHDDPTDLSADERLGAEFWHEALANPDSEGGATALFAVPFWLDRVHTEIDETGDEMWAVSSNTLNYGLLTLPVLPLWVSIDARHEQRDLDPAIRTFNWNPLWATATTKGQSDLLPDIAAWGFPLLYSDVQVTDRNFAANYWQMGWTLGPMWTSFETTPESELSEDIDSAWAFMPLALAGLGPLLWTSFELDAPDASVSAHGPLAGLLGWVDVALPNPEVNEDEAQDDLQLLVGGLLWMHREERDAGGAIRDSLNGPLWGAFGWGHEHGEPFVSLLWIPIPL